MEPAQQPADLRSPSSMAWIVSATGNLAVRMSGLLSGIVLARVLGPAGRGIAAEAVLWPTVVLASGAIINFQTVTYFSSRFGRRGAQACLFVAILVAMLLLPAAWAVNWLALGATGKPSLWTANIYACVLPFSVVSGVFSAALLSEGRLAAFWASRGLAGVLTFVGTLAFALTGKLTPSAYAGAAVVGTIVALLASALSQRTTPLTLSVPAWTTAKAVVAYGAATTLVFMPSQLNFRLDQLLMSLMKSESSLGHYTVAVAWSSTLSVIGAGVAAVVLAQSTRVPLTDPAAMRLMVRRIRLTALLIAAGGVIAALSAPVAVPLIFGRDFRDAVYPAVILSLASIPFYFSGVLHEYARGLGFPRLGVLPEFVGLAVSAVALPLLLRPYGGVGAALASLLSYSTVAVILLRQIGRHVPGMVAADLVPHLADARELPTVFTDAVALLRRRPLGV